MRKILILLMLVVSGVGQLAAQTRTITGKVTEEGSSLPVANASVLIKGTSVGTTTKEDGSWSLSVPATAKVLVVTAIGKSPQEFSVGSSNVIDVSLKNKNEALAEVIVVAYGAQKKTDLTGSVATVKAAELENKPFSSVDKALQGQVAGLQSIASSGQPGASQAILIRGASSITASNSPLWVIDGIPVNTGDVSRLQTTSNLLSTLNPNDIESISVLKDAASQSIYGSRAANGVIVVTTKKGKAGKTRVRFDTEVGQSDIAYRNDGYKPLNADQYFTISKEGMVNAGTSATTTANNLAAAGFGNGVDINWLDAVTRKAGQEQYNLSFDGGNEKTTFYLSGGYFKQEGTTINSKLDRINGNIRINHKFDSRLTINFNMNGGYVNQRAPLNGGAFGNPVLSSYFMLPTRDPYNADGSYKLTSSFGGLHNVIALSDIDKRFLREISLRGNISADYKILENLKFRTSFSGDYSSLEEDQYNNPLHGDGAASGGRAYGYYTRYFNRVWTNTLDLQQALTKGGDLSLNAQVGYESQISKGYLISVQSQLFPSNLDMNLPSVGALPITSGTTLSNYSFASQFASANFNYKDRYILSGSFRRDGSSRFGKENKYGNFWAVGASWNVDQENFMDNVDFIDQLKLRASYGVNGNAGIGNYDWRALYSYGYNYNQTPGSAPSQVGDSTLTWELNKPFNVGIDVAFLNNRVNFTADYYVRKSEDLLLDVPLSRTSGFTSVTRNLGAMENKGIEITINAAAIRSRDFTWNIDFNFAHNKNKITDIPRGEDVLSGNFIIRQGESLNSFYLREYAGVDPSNGDPLFWADATHKTTTTYAPAARTVVGNSLPKYFGALTNTFNYKGFSLDFQLYYNFGNYVYDAWGSYYVGAGFGQTYNKVQRVLNRWQKAGDVTDIPKYIWGGNKSFHSANTFWLNKGDFIRLRNVQLGYTIPKSIVSKAKLSNVFFYVRGTNLWTWVKDDNLPFDPEQGTGSATNLNVFIPKTITAGLNITF